MVLITAVKVSTALAQKLTFENILSSQKNIKLLSIETVGQCNKGFYNCKCLNMQVKIHMPYTYINTHRHIHICIRICRYKYSM